MQLEKSEEIAPEGTKRLSQSGNKAQLQVILLKPKNQTCAIFKKKNVYIALGKYWKHMAQNLEAVVFT